MGDPLIRAAMAENAEAVSGLSDDARLQPINPMQKVIATRKAQGPRLSAEGWLSLPLPRAGGLCSRSACP
jgi:hypothetical protein